MVNKCVGGWVERISIFWFTRVDFNEAKRRMFSPRCIFIWAVFLLKGCCLGEHYWCARKKRKILKAAIWVEAIIKCKITSEDLMANLIQSRPHFDFTRVRPLKCSNVIYGEKPCDARTPNALRPAARPANILKYCQSRPKFAFLWFAWYGQKFTTTFTTLDFRAAPVHFSAESASCVWPVAQ